MISELKAKIQSFFFFWSNYGYFNFAIFLNCQGEDNKQTISGQEPLAKQILQRKWGWIGHTLRKPPANITRQALSWNPQGKRRRGRPCNSWRRDTEAELKAQKLSWKGACDAAQNRVRWKGIVDGLCSNWSRPK